MTQQGVLRISRCGQHVQLGLWRRRVVGLKTRLAIEPTQSGHQVTCRTLSEVVVVEGGVGGGAAVCARSEREVEEWRVTKGENRGSRQKENKP